MDSRLQKALTLRELASTAPNILHKALDAHIYSETVAEYLSKNDTAMDDAQGLRHTKGDLAIARYAAKTIADLQRLKELLPKEPAELRNQDSSKVRKVPFDKSDDIEIITSGDTGSSTDSLVLVNIFSAWSTPSELVFAPMLSSSAFVVTYVHDHGLNSWTVDKKYRVACPYAHINETTYSVITHHNL